MTRGIFIGIALALSLLSNAALVIVLHHSVSRYNSLLVWACEAGNGGYECGEE
jgi:hypothetical protein